MNLSIKQLAMINKFIWVAWFTSSTMSLRSLTEYANRWHALSGLSRTIVHLTGTPAPRVIWRVWLLRSLSMDFLLPCRLIRKDYQWWFSTTSKTTSILLQEDCQSKGLVATSESRSTGESTYSRQSNRGKVEQLFICQCTPLSRENKITSLIQSWYPSANCSAYNFSDKTDENIFSYS